MQSTSKWFKYSILNKILAGAPFSCQRERSARTGYRSLWGRVGDRCAGAAKIFLHSFARETQAVFPAVKLHNVTARAPKPKKAPRSVIIIAFGGAPDLSKKADRVVSARLARLCRLAWVRTSANNGRVRPAVLPCEILPKSQEAASEKLTQTPPPVFGAACEI